MNVDESMSLTRNANRTLSRNEVFDLLSNHRRRYALHIAKRDEGPSELSDMAAEIAAWENQKEPKAVTSDERHRVYTSMQQVHFPAMDKAGVIEYDNGTVRLTEQATDLDVYMDVVPDRSIPWGEYYLGLAGVSAALLGANAIGVFPPSIPLFAMSSLVVALFFGSAAYHVWESRKHRLGTTDNPPETVQ